MGVEAVTRLTRGSNFPLPPRGEGGRAPARPGGGSFRRMLKSPPPPAPPHKGEGSGRSCRGIEMTEIDNITRRRCRELRNNSTPPERILWQYLRILNQGGGLNFRRQAPIGKFIA